MLLDLLPPPWLSFFASFMAFPSTPYPFSASPRAHSSTQSISPQVVCVVLTIPWMLTTLNIHVLTRTLPQLHTHNIWPELNTSPRMFHWLLKWTCPKRRYPESFKIGFSLWSPPASSPNIKTWGRPWLFPLPSIPNRELINCWFHLIMSFSWSYSRLPHFLSRVIYTNADGMISFSCLKVFKCLPFSISDYPSSSAEYGPSLPLEPHPWPLPALDICASDSELLDFSERYHATVRFFTFPNSF